MKNIRKIFIFCILYFIFYILYFIFLSRLIIHFVNSPTSSFLPIYSSSLLSLSSTQNSLPPLPSTPCFQQLSPSPSCKLASSQPPVRNQPHCEEDVLYISVSVLVCTMYVHEGVCGPPL